MNESDAVIRFVVIGIVAVLLASFGLFIGWLIATGGQPKQGAEPKPTTKPEHTAEPELPQPRRLTKFEAVEIAKEEVLAKLPNNARLVWFEIGYEGADENEYEEWRIAGVVHYQLHGQAKRRDFSVWLANIGGYLERKNVYLDPERPDDGL